MKVDPDGITRYITNDGKVFAEYDGDGNLKYNYIYGNGQKLAKVDIYEAVEYYHNNYLGSVQAITDASGVHEGYEYAGSYLADDAEFQNKLAQNASGDQTNSSFQSPDITSQDLHDYISRGRYEDYLLNDMGNIPGLGNNASDYKNVWGPERNECSFRIQRALDIEAPIFNTNTVGKYLGSPVDHNPYLLQVVNWAGSHMGFTRNNIVYDMSPLGLNNTTGRDLQRMINKIFGGRIPSYYNIPYYY